MNRLKLFEEFILEMKLPFEDGIYQGADSPGKYIVYNGKAVLVTDSTDEDEKFQAVDDFDKEKSPWVAKLGQNEKDIVIKHQD